MRKEIQRLENALFKISSQAPKIDSLLKQAFENLLNLRQLFENADVPAKRKLIHSIYPEKLVFAGDHYRTTRVNEVVLLIYKLEADLGENKNGGTDVKIDLSTWVAGIGDFSNHFLSDLKLLSSAMS